MADKFQDLAGRMAKAPKGSGTGVALLAGAVALGYGIKEAIYTGIFCCVRLAIQLGLSAVQLQLN